MNGVQTSIGGMRSKDGSDLNIMFGNEANKMLQDMEKQDTSRFSTDVHAD